MNKRGGKPLFSRQKLLLALLQAFGGRLPSTDFQKYLFLFTQTCQEKKSYEFVPYRFGCFSFQSYADRRRLIDIGVIKGVEGAEDVESIRYWELADKGADYLSQITAGERKQLLSFRNQYKNVRGGRLVREVYRSYPYYAIKSEVKTQLMTEEELAEIKKATPSDDGFAFFTIGYEKRSFEHYLNRLIRNNVRMLCDVRKNPISRKYGFSKTTLSKTLRELGIAYRHIPELGIDSEKRRELNSQADYDRLFDEYEHSVLKRHENALDGVYEMLKRYKRVAITCFEADYGMCHRSRIADALSRRPGWKLEVNHI